MVSYADRTLPAKCREQPRRAVEPLEQREVGQDRHAQSLETLFGAALETRDLIGQAKGMIVASIGCTPDDAFGMLAPRRSMRTASSPRSPRGRGAGGQGGATTKLTEEPRGSWLPAKFSGSHLFLGVLRSVVLVASSGLAASSLRRASSGSSAKIMRSSRSARVGWRSNGTGTRRRLATSVSEPRRVPAGRMLWSAR